MKCLTIAMPYYMNPAMLRLQLDNWQSWPDHLRKRLKVVLVDDGSPVGERAEEVPLTHYDIDIRIFRVLEDRPWHQHGARNLSAKMADDGWMLLTDMDHMLTSEQAEDLFDLIDKGLHDGCSYMLARRECTTGLPTLGRGGEHKPHPNSFLLTKKQFWRIGGYDEDFCGIYGTDRLFRERVAREGGIEHLTVTLTRFWREVIPDASTRNQPRKEGRDPTAKKRVLARKAEQGRQDKITVLNFDWQQVV